MRCHYEVLDVARDAEEAEIKVAYKKLALRWHPDKNLDNIEEAKVQFQELQQAYEVLSDRQERAWYDNHREQILRGADKDYEDNCLDVFQYFTSSCFKGFGDDDNGFYAVYRKVFEDIAKEDLEYMDNKDEFLQVPMFGGADSDYDDVVGCFYNFWMSYSTKKSYVWLDPYDIKETRERRVVKLIEKENKKVRAKAKKERNEEVRNLVAFVRKRDKRVQANAKRMEAKALENKLKQEEISKQRRKERRDEIRQSAGQPEWAKFDNVQSELEQIEKSLAEQFGDDISNSEDEEEVIIDEDLYCAACNKIFKTPKAIQNHETSKKHKENVEKLKEILLEEDDEFIDDIDESDDIEEEILIEELSENSEELEDEEINKIKKDKKKNKKKNVLKIDSEEEHLELKVDESNDDDFQANKKQKKKTNRKKKDTKINDAAPSVQVEKEEVFIEPVAKSKGAKKKKNDKSEMLEVIDKDHQCVSCNANFDSKNKLFNHLKKTGHSVYLPQMNDSSVKLKSKGIK